MQCDSNQPPDLLMYKKPQDREDRVKQRSADAIGKIQKGRTTHFLNKVQAKKQEIRGAIQRH